MLTFLILYGIVGAALSPLVVAPVIREVKRLNPEFQEFPVGVFIAAAALFIVVTVIWPVAMIGMFRD